MSLVHELERDALNPKAAVSDLLRKALVIARKLRLTELGEWAEAELKGYHDKKVPDYRVLSGDIRVPSVHYGSIPLLFSNQPEARETLSIIPISLPVAELEALLATPDSDFFAINYPPEFEASLLRQTGRHVFLQVSRAAVESLLDGVRNAVLEWALKLEAEGIVGQDMSFSPEERQIATTINIGNVIGTIAHSTVQQGTTGSTQQNTVTTTDIAALQHLFAELVTLLKATESPSAESRSVVADVETIQAQLSRPQPRMPLIRELWHSTRTVLEHGAAHVLGSAVAHKLPELLSRISAALS